MLCNPWKHGKAAAFLNAHFDGNPRDWPHNPACLWADLTTLPVGRPHNPVCGPTSQPCLWAGPASQPRLWAGPTSQPRLWADLTTLSVGWADLTSPSVGWADLTSPSVGWADLTTPCVGWADLTTPCVGRPYNPVCGLGQSHNPVCGLGQSHNPVCGLGQSHNPVCGLGRPHNPVCELGQSHNPVCGPTKEKSVHPIAAGVCCCQKSVSAAGVCCCQKSVQQGYVAARSQCSRGMLLPEVSAAGVCCCKKSVQQGYVAARSQCSRGMLLPEVNECSRGMLLPEVSAAGVCCCQKCTPLHPLLPESWYDCSAFAVVVVVVVVVKECKHRLEGLVARHRLESGTSGIFFFCVPSCIFGVHHFGWDFYVCDRLTKSNYRGSHTPSSWLVHAECVFVTGIHPSRTWMSGSLDFLRWNACVHGLDLGLYSHPNEFLGSGVRTHVNSKGKINYQRIKRGSNQRRCITQDSEPYTLPTELFRPVIWNRTSLSLWGFWFKPFYSKTNNDVYKVSKEKSINKLALRACSANNLHRITSVWRMTTRKKHT